MRTPEEKIRAQLIVEGANHVWQAAARARNFEPQQAQSVQLTLHTLRLTIAQEG